MKQIIFVLLLSSPLMGMDRYVSTVGNDLNGCISGMPCKTLTKALSVRLPGERIFMDAGTYDLSNAEPVTLIPSGVVLIHLPNSTVPLDANFQLWTPLPSTADVKVSLKPGGVVTSAVFTRRKTDLSKVLRCEGPKSMTVAP